MTLKEQLEGKLIVSCQAYPGEPLREPHITAMMAKAVVEGGAAAVRVQGIEDIKATAEAVTVPVVGLWKDGHEGVYITPTPQHARACAEAGADIVAIDATDRPRPDGSSFADCVRATHEAGALVMADCSCLDDAVRAEADGADFIGTTLAGYTESRPKTEGPDLELVKEVLGAVTKPVIVEGRIHSPEDLKAVMELGPCSACVGTAITHPTSLTKWFVAKLPA
ncbi:N-acetylmannosamine-6-phosphate 2-epimerase [Boudabousia liubingyangii]|uniref:Putative N-acetylmannosamine-6-phosphate 2-epimerase n=1 Tax=Boudabousia liubingyangii TaxID=1921764 RepID=A0A1Q5PKK8_9ACTO|nr:N-acetylmannosamine-6-phosphate 2-epimerase [Boudabousia liubingyangii]OKL46506.1 N-acetylmannosamine-6-phosphate 2-epimerase [Boudabousia liubingyangii]OKL47173.1 N-acetylmannosamine-6-phosphate 2-epimerase [Boudabousia liubingyangii]